MEQTPQVTSKRAGGQQSADNTTCLWHLMSTRAHPDIQRINLRSLRPRNARGYGDILAMPANPPSVTIQRPLLARRHRQIQGIRRIRGPGSRFSPKAQRPISPNKIIGLCASREATDCEPVGRDRALGSKRGVRLENETRRRGAIDSAPKGANRVTFRSRRICRTEIKPFKREFASVLGRFLFS